MDDRDCAQWFATDGLFQDPPEFTGCDTSIVSFWCFSASIVILLFFTCAERLHAFRWSPQQRHRYPLAELVIGFNCVAALVLALLAGFNVISYRNNVTFIVIDLLFVPYSVQTVFQLHKMSRLSKSLLLVKKMCPQDVIIKRHKVELVFIVAVPFVFLVLFLGRVEDRVVIGSAMFAYFAAFMFVCTAGMVRYFRRCIAALSEHTRTANRVGATTTTGSRRNILGWAQRNMRRRMWATIVFGFAISTVFLLLAVGAVPWTFYWVLAPMGGLYSLNQFLVQFYLKRDRPPPASTSATDQQQETTSKGMQLMANNPSNHYNMNNKLEDDISSVSKTKKTAAMGLLAANDMERHSMSELDAGSNNNNHLMQVVAFPASLDAPMDEQQRRKFRVAEIINLLSTPIGLITLRVLFILVLAAISLTVVMLLKKFETENSFGEYGIPGEHFEPKNTYDPLLPYAGPACSPPARLDMVWLIDQSDYMKDDVETSAGIRQMIIQLATNAPPGGGTYFRQAFALYSGPIGTTNAPSTIGARLLFTDARSESKQDFINLVGNLSFNTGGTSDIAAGLDFVRTSVFTNATRRDGSERVVVLITHWGPTNSQDESVSGALAEEAARKLVDEDRTTLVWLKYGPNAKYPDGFLDGIAATVYNRADPALLAAELSTSYRCGVTSSPTMAPTSSSPSKSPTSSIPSKSPSKSPTRTPSVAPTRQATFTYAPGPKTTASGAAAACQSVGKNLASIFSQAENDRVSSVTGGGNPAVWISLARSTVAPSTFVWGNNVALTNTSFSDWMENEPNDEFGGENCVVFARPDIFSHVSGTWNDEACGNFYFPLCEVRP